jgi:hypothetical protein
MWREAAWRARTAEEIAVDVPDWEQTTGRADALERLTVGRSPYRRPGRMIGQ